MRKIYTQSKKFVAQEDGATMVEYGLMVALIAVVAITGETLLGNNVLAIFNDIAAQLTGPTTT